MILKNYFQTKHTQAPLKYAAW